jgi:tRNA threonylcarbamoyladenosine biosynthesis protein TsaB
MRILTIETSTPLEIVAVVQGGAVAAESRTTAGRGHRDRLASSIEQVLDESGNDLRALGAIAVSIGPGRFTGLRVGLATAKGLAVTAGLGVRPVRTLPALALSAGATDGLVCPALDARRGEVYAALLRPRSGAVVMSEEALVPSDLARRVGALSRGEPVIFVGTGAVAYRDEIGVALGPLARFAPNDLTAPSPLALARLAAGAPELRDEALAALEPVYLRGVVADRGRGRDR